jgi:hypothetical protein
MKTYVAERKGLYFKLLIVALAIALVFCFWFSGRSSAEPLSLTVMPSVPRQGEPVVATFKLNNPSSEPLVTSFQYYANGDLVRDGRVTLAPGTSQTLQEVYANNLPIGQQLNFMVKTQSTEGNHDSLVSTPPVPPQVLSSFISFAALSSVMLTYMSSMAYYQGGFGANKTGLDIGIMLVLTLIGLLIFLELTTTPVQGKTMALGRLRIRLSTLTWVLLIIFVGMVFTRVVLILTG